MQAAANAVQDHMGPLPTVVNPEYKHRTDGSTMKALAWFGTKDVRVIDAAIPDITEADDVIVKVTGTTICGSDLHLYHGEIMTMQKGDILGHEFMGVVDRIGPNVHNLKPGQRVVASFQIACGECEYCKKKLSSFCDRTNNSSLQNAMYGQRDAGFFGYSHFTGGFPGGQAEYVRVPKGNVNLLPIPDGISDEKAIYLSDILPTSYHAVVDTGVEKDDVVGIWGLGPIGLCAARWAQLKGAKRIIGIDAVPERLAFAREKLGIETIDFKEYTDVTKRVYEMVPRGLDVALDCGSFHEPKSILHKVQKTLMLETDVPETINEMIVSVRKMGRAGIIAAYAGYANGVNVGALMEKGVRLIGNGQAPVHKYWEEILNDYIIPGKFDPTFVITHRVPIDDMAKLYAAFDTRQAGVEKVFVETKFSSKPDPGCPLTTRVDDWKSKN
ncbi:GroES-like protein [Crucibulum laeve]|uniref:GroES-like protein n=1 Tax=Crucibulum laeve TaxID=68775 RepID=A0A5C3M2C6_9AGAR|nr:GroES-like protein [Crucibulum laeve]